MKVQSISQLPDELQTGRHEPMGALVRDGGVNFAVFSEHARCVELCVFDALGETELRRYALHGPHDGVFHGFLSGLGPGLVYGLRAHGSYAPEHGHRFNPHKLLLDPWAREIVGRFELHAEHHGYEVGHPDGMRSMDSRDSAVWALKARVAASAGPDQASPRSSAPRHAAADLVLCEVHVKGFSMQLADIPDALRGTYAGLAHPASIAHFKHLGVTTLLLLPVQYSLAEPHLMERGLPNYWGYNTLGFFCPDPRLACAAHREDPTAVAEEFRQMVEALHRQGLEVVLDVVYNHTAEGGEPGPTLSFRGLDNASWYRLGGHDKSHYENISGCGNTLNCAHTRVAQFVLDSLRHWVSEMGVDGFRFDLAPVLGRTAHGFDANAGFFTALRQDPVLAGVHLIAEPWDSGHDGYHLGRFPGRFMEWNDRFRDAVRGYWLRGGNIRSGELARRFMGSSDLFHHGLREPLATVNFVAVHDGFTLADVVSYSRKHNEANGEDNRDGREGELCANFGVEGPTDDPAIQATRARVKRAMLATLMLAQGTPMLCAGDEIGHSQRGNNNAYCQDNATTWLNWNHAEQAMREFVMQLLSLRRSEPLLRHGRWFVAPPGCAGEACLYWFNPHGHEMSHDDWHDTDNHAFAAQLCKVGAEHAVLMIIFNPEPEPVPFTIRHGPWRLLLDSSAELLPGELRQGVPLIVPSRALLVLKADEAASQIANHNVGVEAGAGSEDEKTCS